MRGKGSRVPALPVQVLYEDEDILAVDKPPGLPTIAPEGKRSRNLYDMVTAYIQRGNPKGRAAVVHRIDRDSSGVVVFAKNAATKRVLMAAWNELVVSRRYVALIEGRMPGDSGVLDSWLRENRGGTVYQVPRGTQGALRAITRWRSLEDGRGYSLLELELETGRKHQIRAQLAAAGHPVAGDFRYGARGDPAGRLALHAVSIELTWPPGGGTRRVESPVPESMLRPLRGKEKGLYYGMRRAESRRSPRADSGVPRMTESAPGLPASGGGAMKEKSKQAKEPKKKPQKTLKEKRKEKKEKASNKTEE